VPFLRRADFAESTLHPHREGTSAARPHGHDADARSNTQGAEQETDALALTARREKRAHYVAPSPCLLHEHRPDVPRLRRTAAVVPLRAGHDRRGDATADHCEATHGKEGARREDGDRRGRAAQQRDVPEGARSGTEAPMRHWRRRDRRRNRAAGRPARSRARMPDGERGHRERLIATQPRIQNRS